jgi:hypothetical protein
MSKRETMSCDSHGETPWHLVCIHLPSTPAHEWVAVGLDESDPMRMHVDADWICVRCMRLADESGGDVDVLAKYDVLKVACMHCVNKLKEQAGFIRDEAGILVKPE